MVLFCQAKNPQKELWDGVLLGPDAAIEILGVDDAYPVADIDEILPGLIEGRDRVYYSLGKDDRFDDQPCLRPGSKASRACCSVKPVR